MCIIVHYMFNVVHSAWPVNVVVWCHLFLFACCLCCRHMCFGVSPPSSVPLVPHFPCVCLGVCAYNRDSM